MHRTIGDGYITDIDGKNLYADEDPPTRNATQLRHQEMNAIQEEICNVIEWDMTPLNAPTETPVEASQLNIAIDAKDQEIYNTVTAETDVKFNAIKASMGKYIECKVLCDDTEVEMDSFVGTVAKYNSGFLIDTAKVIKVGFKRGYVVDAGTNGFSHYGMGGIVHPGLSWGTQTDISLYIVSGPSYEGLFADTDDAAVFAFWGANVFFRRIGKLILDNVTRRLVPIQNFNNNHFIPQNEYKLFDVALYGNGLNSLTLPYLATGESISLQINAIFLLCTVSDSITLYRPRNSIILPYSSYCALFWHYPGDVNDLFAFNCITSTTIRVGFNLSCYHDPLTMNWHY